LNLMTGTAYTSKLDGIPRASRKIISGYGGIFFLTFGFKDALVYLPFCTENRPFPAGMSIVSLNYTLWLIGEWAGDHTIALHTPRLRILGNISQAIVCILPQGS